MKTTKINNNPVGVVGLGCMGMSWAYGSPDNETSLKVLDRALELGVNHWDTADLYGAGENEKLLSEALKGKRDKVFLATKFGNVFDRSLTTHQDQVSADAPWIVDGTPQYVQKCIDNSLSRLQVDHVDLYYLHRVDPTVPIEDTVGAMSRLVEQGKVKSLGLSEVNPDTLRRAVAVHPIAAVQNELSLWTRDSQHDVLPACEELGIAFVPYSPLGRGFLTGSIKSIDDLPADDWRRNNPRFQGDNLQKNLEIVKTVEEVAAKHGVPASQVALAWVLQASPAVAAIPGTKRIKYLESNAAAADLTLTQEEWDTLDKVSAAAGARYPETMMSFTKA